MECGNTDDGLGEMDTAGPAELADVVEDFSGNIQEYLQTEFLNAMLLPNNYAG